MSFRIISSLMPVPGSIVFQLEQLALKYRGKRIMVSPHCELVCNLYLRGHFKKFDFVGAIDKDPRKQGRTVLGIPVHASDSLPLLDIDAVFVIHNQYHRYIRAALKNELPEKIDLLDLSESYSDRNYRKEIASYFSLNNIEMLRPGFITNQDFLSSSLSSVEITIESRWGLGDRVCLLSAAREFSRRHPDLDVKLNDLGKVVSAYQDNLISSGQGLPLPDNTNALHRTKMSSPAGNYLGCFYLGLGMDFEGLPAIELPDVPLLEGLQAGNYIALQPTANFAKPNIDFLALQEIISACPLPVVLTGPFQPVNSYLPTRGEQHSKFSQADDRYYDDEMAMLQIISHAALVLTPRSASAHIAAAYQVPAIVWVPNDGENWHLDYPLWDCRQISVTEGAVVQEVVGQIKSFFNNNKAHHKGTEK